MRSDARLSIAIILVGLVAVACATGATTTPTRTAPTPAPTVADPAPTQALTEHPTATPIPMTDGKGPEYVVGTSSLNVTKDGTSTVVGDVTQLRGQEMTAPGTMNDPRLTGVSHIVLNADIHGSVASEWGTSRIETADGAWEGTWTGASWNAGAATSVGGWLVGSGAYEGYTYYFHVFGPSMPFQVEGIIFPGPPPAP
jgi:hypothetical protein